MRRRLPASLIIGAALLLCACPKQVPLPQDEEADAGVATAPVAVEPVAAPAPTGPGLVVSVEPDDAELLIDGVSYGPVAGLKTQNGLLPLKPGIYQVALKKAGYTSWRAEVTVNEGPEHLAVTLTTP